MKGITYIKDKKGRSLQAKVDLSMYRNAFEKFFGQKKSNVVDLKLHQDTFDKFHHYVTKSTKSLRTRKPDLPPMMPPPTQRRMPVRKPDIPSMIRPTTSSSQTNRKPDIPGMIKPES